MIGLILIFASDCMSKCASFFQPIVERKANANYFRHLGKTALIVETKHKHIHNRFRPLQGLSSVESLCEMLLYGNYLPPSLCFVCRACSENAHR